LIISQITRQYSTVYRNDTYNPNSTNITVYVKDANTGPAISANVSFYNSTDYFDSCLTNDTGYCLIVYNPVDITTPNQYNIFLNATKTGTESSATNNTDVTVKGVLLLNITSPENGTYYGKSDSITLRANVTDENGNTNLAPSVKWYNDTSYIGSGSTISSFSLLTQLTGWRMFISNATKSFYDQSEDNITIRINSESNIYWMSPPNETHTVYPYQFERLCRVIDRFSGGGITNYPVEFYYHNGTSYVFNGTFITNGTGYVNQTWTPQDKGNVTFLCNITDNTTLIYSTFINFAVGKIWVKDVTPPATVNLTVLPNVSIEVNLNTTNISADVTDDYGIKDVWATVSMPNGTQQNVSMTNISLTRYRGQYLPIIGGMHNATVYALDADPENNLNHSFAGYFDVWNIINYSLINYPDEVTAINITQTQNYKFNLTINFTNLGPPNIHDVNLTIYDSPTGYLQLNDSDNNCGDMPANETCKWAVHVTVLPKTPSILIYLYSNVTWRNPDNTRNSTTNTTLIIVSENPVIDLYEDTVTKETPHDKTTFVGNVTVISRGNSPITYVNLTLVGGNLALSCPLCNITMFPDSQGIMAAGVNFTATIKASIPKGTTPGFYWSIIRASSSNAGYDQALLNITVPLNNTWQRAPETFGVVISPLNRIANISDINISNIGNVKLSFTFYKTGLGANYLIVVPNAMDIERSVSRNVTIGYSIPMSATPGLYPAEIAIRARETETGSSATPTQYNVNLTLNITDVSPTIVEVNVTPQTFEIIYESINISANITDNIAVSKAWINVTRPHNITYFNSSFMMHNTSVYPDRGTNRTEEINITGQMKSFNVTLYNRNGTTIYINLTINGALIKTNQSIENGTNYTIDAADLITFNLPGNQTINISITGPELTRYFNFSTLMNNATNPSDTGFNKTEEITEPGVMSRFNFTLHNINNSTIYLNIIINGALITSNQSVLNNTNYTINAANLTTFYLPANQTINLTITNVSGDIVSANYTAWTEYTIARNISSNAQYANYTTWLAYQVIRGLNAPYMEMMSYNGAFYTVLYNTTLIGVHNIYVCANDTNGLTVCGSPNYVTSVANTTITTTFNTTQLLASNITLTQGAFFGVNYTTNNTGYARAFNLTVNMTYHRNITIQPNTSSTNALLKWSHYNSTISVNVSAATPPGLYQLNFTPYWKNLNNQTNTTVYTLSLNVTSNPILTIIEDNITIYAPHGSSGVEQINLMSTGNDNVTNVTFICISGDVCSNFTVSYNPSNYS
jgi:hypothetical protein